MDEPLERKPMRLAPHVTEAVWGGNRLAAEYGVDPAGRKNCAEAWMLSGHPRGSSLVRGGAYDGMPLEALFHGRRELFGEACAGLERFPVLVKLIDAREDLSIQVHPGDNDFLLPGESGKTECWYILDAEPGAKLYLGFQEAITREQFTHAIENKTLMGYVQTFEAQAEDFFYIPAGTLHAIGKGILLAEVQQSSDTTYRVYDYNRLENGRPRPLHVERARVVTELGPYEPTRERFKLFGTRKLVSCEHFTVEECAGRGEAGEDSFVHLLFLEADGGCVLECGGAVMPIKKGDSVLIPAGAGKYSVDGGCRALETRL
jgi:mannose-6-phosphate isomerase